MNQAWKLIASRLSSIEQSARQTLRDVEFIRGVYVGVAVMAEEVPSPAALIPEKSNGGQEVIPQTIQERIKEVEEMIITLNIKGSVREHRNGLLKFTSSTLGCVYGRTKEEIGKKINEKIIQLKQCKGKKNKDEKKKQTPLLSEYYRTEYLPYKRSNGIAEHTIEMYEKYMRFIVKDKFDKALSWYKPKDIQTYLYSFPQTRKRQIMQGFLNNMLNHAITSGYIKINPCSSVEKVKHKQEQGKCFSFDELSEFFDLLQHNQRLTYTQKCYFVLVFLVGARMAEILELKAEDVDTKNKVLHIRGTKTEGSDRLVPLTPLVEKLLASLNTKKGKYFDMTQNYAHKRFRDVWASSKGHKLHDLRHTYGTIQICVEKVDVKTVSLWLGHSTTAMTLNTYTHPEQLDSGTFLRGDCTNDEKTAIYKQKYAKVMHEIEGFLG